MGRGHIRWARTFWPMIFILALAVVAVLLGSCESVTLKRGDEVTTVTALFTKIKLTSSCAQYDSSGNVLAQTAQDFGSEGDTAMLHEAGSIFSSGVALALKMGGKAATGGVAPVRGTVETPDGHKAIIACNGEHLIVIPALESKEP